MTLIHPSIDPVIVSFGYIQIRWYGIAYLLGFIIGLYLLKKINRNKKNKINNKHIEDFFIWSIFSVILGGRLGYIIFYQTGLIFSNPIEILYIWKGGMSFHGGLLGIIICMFIFTKLRSIHFYQLSDLVSLVAPIGLFLGRLANFINVELYGRVTNFPISMIYPTIDNAPRHPSQLYEAFFEGFVIFIVLIYYNNKYNNKNMGIITGLFLILYGFFRFILEFTREPDAHIGLILTFFTTGQLLSLPLIFFGILIYNKQKKYND